jgi:hypothetical protein
MVMIAPEMGCWPPCNDPEKTGPVGVGVVGLVGAGSGGAGLVGAGSGGAGLVGAGSVGAGLVGVGLVGAGSVGAGLVGAGSVGAGSVGVGLGVGMIGDGMVGEGVVGDGIVGVALPAVNPTMPEPQPEIARLTPNTMKPLMPRSETRKLIKLLSQVPQLFKAQKEQNKPDK